MKLATTSSSSIPKKQLCAGEVGYIVAGVKSVQDVEIGDTITLLDRQADEPIPGYKKAKQVVFSSIYPMDTGEYVDLTKALDKLAINDAALTYEKDSSAALGFGFRCGFLGLLHLDVVQERLQREFDLGLVISAPSVKYQLKAKRRHGDRSRQPELLARSDADRLGHGAVHQSSVILTPEEYVGPVMELCREHPFGESKNDLPLGGADRSDKRDAAGRGSFRLLRQAQDDHARLRVVCNLDHEPIEYRKTDVVKVDILVNKEPVDTLAYLVHSRQGENSGTPLLRATCRGDSQPPIQDPRARRDWWHGHRAIHHPTLSQGRDREALRW